MTQDNQPFMQQLADMSPGLLYLFDIVERRTLYINARSLELLGYAPETVLTMGAKFMAEVMHPDDLAQMSAHFERLNSAIDGSFFDIEYRMRHVDGEWRWFSSRDRVFSRTSAGQIQQVLGIAQDISEAKRAEGVRQQAEEALRQSEAKYRTLFESMSEGFALIEMIFDENGAAVDCCYLEVNPAFARLTGIEAATGKRIKELVPNLEPLWLENYGRVALTGEPSRIENQAAGLNSWFEVYAFRVGNETSRKVACLFFNTTDRKQAEAALRESEERFHTLADNIAQFAWMADENGWIFWYNQRWFDYTGTTLEEMQGWGWQKVHHPEHVDRVVEHIRHCFETGETWEDTFPLRGKDGEYHWFLSRAQPIQDEQGKVLRWFGTNTDIRDRRQIEETLRQREAELRLVTNAIPALVSFIDSDQCYRFTNRGYEDWFGHPATEIYGKSIREVLGETAYERIRLYVEQVLAGQTVTFESQLPYKDRGTRYVSATYVPRLNSQGAVEGFVALVTDISDRKQAEIALQQSEERYRYLAEMIPQLIWAANADGVLIDINQRWSDFTGLTLIQAQTQGWEAVVHPDDLPTLNQNWVAAQQVGNHYRAEGRMRRADGAYRWHLHEAIPLKNQQGQLVKWFGTATDIEVQKHLEHQRQSLLEREQAAREQAETANRVKDEFLAVLSHELRSPLNPILGWTRLLQNGKLDAARKSEALKTIERNAKLQSQLIEDLLDISRIMQGKLTLTAAPTSLTFVIAAALETVQLAAEAKNIQITLDLDPAIAPIAGDAARLQQVVWNLLTNAVKFTPNGGQVTIDLSQIDRLAQIRVIDTGKGINPKFLLHVFEYFQQEDSSTTRRFGGLGLGLAIVRQIVEMHGGTVKAESQGENQGSTFIVQLPTLQQATPILSEATCTQSDTEMPLDNVQILLVDDDTDTREFQTFLLEQNGAKVIAVASGLEALQALEQFIPDVIVSDIGMAEMDGYMLMQQIRSRPVNQCGTILAIALTAYAAEVDQQKALQAGFQAHLTKPVEPEEVVKTIVTLISRNSDETLI